MTLPVERHGVDQGNVSRILPLGLLALENRRQRRSAEMARYLESVRLPATVAGKDPRQTPGNCGVSAAWSYGPRFAGKWVVEGAVTSEPVSTEIP